MRHRILCLLLIASAIPMYAQGPIDGYLKGKGVLDLAPSFSINRAKQFEGGDGRLYDLPYRGSMLSLFAEYGLTKRIDVVATGAIVFTESQSGLQDGGVFLKYRPLYTTIGEGRLGLLLSAGASFPLSNYAATASGALGQKAVFIPGRLVLQYEWSGWFANLTYGYHLRLDEPAAVDVARIQQQRPAYVAPEPPDVSSWLFKTGFAARHFYIDAWVERQDARGGTDYVPDLPDLPQAYGVSFTHAGGTLYYSESGKNGVFLGGAYIFSGRNTGRLFRLSFGAVFKII